MNTLFVITYIVIILVLVVVTLAVAGITSKAARYDKIMNDFNNKFKSIDEI